MEPLWLNWTRSGPDGATQALAGATLALVEAPLALNIQLRPRWSRSDSDGTTLVSDGLADVVDVIYVNMKPDLGGVVGVG
jgi:hypothetical protein